MTRLSWDSLGAREYHTGVDRGVLYINGTGYSWSGLVSVSESTDGADLETFYLDGRAYLNYVSNGNYKAVIKAYTYPPEFSECDGSQVLATGVTVTNQYRKPFGFSYRTGVGNDIQGRSYGYLIHLVYEATAATSDRDYSTNTETIEALEFSWEISARPVEFYNPAFGVKYSSHVIFDTTKMYPWAVKALEDLLYGNDINPPTLPSPEELIKLLNDNALFRVEYLTDDIYTVDGPESSITINPVEYTPIAENDPEPGFFLVNGREFGIISGDPGVYSTPYYITDPPEDPGIFMINNGETFTLNWPSVNETTDDTFSTSSL